MSCAICRSPAHAYGPPNGWQSNWEDRNSRQGARPVPSLRYVLNRTPIWNKEFIANPVERILEGEEPPTGGLTWDGRFNTLHEQATFPLAPNEMANAGPKETGSYANDLRRQFGPDILDDPRAYAATLIAIERFELEDASFHPYSSKYDDYLDGKMKLTAQEQRGLTLFDDPKRGNSATCHLDRKGVDGSHSIFTDYQFEALGVLRNPEILANASPDYFDMGLCGPVRADQAKESKFCGLFKTPRCGT
jgi:cytochrome c peroxidase